MSFHSQDTLQAWLDEFLALGYALSSSVKVIPQDGEHGEDTGLVAVSLYNASTETSIQPESTDSHRWVITMEPRETAVVFDAAGLHDLSTELSIASSLCAFLEAKSLSASEAPD